MKTNEINLIINKNLIVLLIAFFTLFSCKKKIEQDFPSINSTEKIAPDGFLFTTSKTIQLSVFVKTNTNKALKGVALNIYTIKAKGVLGNKIYTGFSDASGLMSATITIPAYIDTLIIDPEYLGLLRNTKAVITNNTITGTIGGNKSYAGSIIGSMDLKFPAYQKNQIRFNSTDMVQNKNINGVSTNTIFSYLSPYDSDGKPTVLAPSDEIDAAILESLNASLPEREDVRDHHPEYLNSNASSNLIIEKNADVWITFVSEGAGYRNSIGFYTYPTNTPPSSLSDITAIKFIFPNASLEGGNGSLYSGEKVKIGNFNAGTTIGFVIFSNGWDDSKVDISNDAFFSNDYLNPESTADLRRHTVLLKYGSKYIIGFDDINRDWGSDHDFNDVLVYASANPTDAISNQNVRIADSPIDTDLDGVNDLLDEFPTDPNRAYTNYYPAKDAWANIAFEDQWPVSGDYDLNDLVVKYQYKWVCNGSNQVVELFANYAPIASGATYQNGFGVQFPFTASNIQSVTGYHHTDNYISLNANGTEASQSNAVIIPFDNCRSLIKPVSASSPMINTDMSLAKVQGDTTKLKISFTSPLSMASFGIAPFNPFIICDKKRGFEVHLPGMLPTDLIDKTQFGKGVDNTNPASNTYFVTKQNYPWALNFMDNYIYPIEQKSIGDAYLKFFNWAGSGGRDFSDWNSNTTSGYRNNSLLYTK